jgi:hypothetical protein
VSKAFLKKLLNETLDVLDDKTFRTVVSDYKKHEFAVSSINIRSELKKQLSFTFAPKGKSNKGKEKYPEYSQADKKMINDIIVKEASIISKKAYEGAKLDASNFVSDSGSYITINGTPTNFVIVSMISLADTRNIQIWGGKKEIPESVFQRMRQYFKQEVASSTKKILEALGVADKKRLNQKLLDLGHMDETAVAAQQVSIASLFFEENYEDVKSKGISAADLRSIGIKISMIKASKTNIDSVRVILESSSKNRSAGTTAESVKAKAAFRKQLKNAIIELEKQDGKYTGASGSDSRMTITKKRVVHSFNKALKLSNPSLKIKKSGVLSKKIEQTKNAKATKEYNPRVTKGRVESGIGSIAIQKGAEKKLKGKGGRDSSANSTVSLMALINNALPEALKKNMINPGLVNRSGKFAESVLVTDITETAQGFPSIGYTYQKNPYQIFEQGAGKAPWSTAQRDPRKLVDKTIREIAIGLVTGRLYTRRV